MITKSYINLLSKPLPIECIDFRIQSINKGGYATILAYKDARADMNRLDEVVGCLNWKREHTRDNKNCIVSIWDEEKAQWVSKEDTGTESNAEKEKGLASDSFKRACFNWGIGRELYDYPVIQVKLNSDEFEIKNDKAYPTWNLKIPQWKWESIFDEEGLIIALRCIDEKGIQRFLYDKQTKPKKELFNNKHPRWVGAVGALRNGKTTIEEIKKTFPDITEEVIIQLKTEAGIQ